MKIGKIRQLITIFPGIAQGSLDLIIEDIVNFCEVKDCQINLGDPQVGFIQIDGSGLKHLNNYQRYLSLNELSDFPSPDRVVKQASIFTIQRGQETETLDRAQFERELKDFRLKAGI